MHKRFIIKFKSCIDMITLFPTIPAFCQFAMVKSYQGWWSYGCDYIEMMMMMMMMASRTMIMLRRCFAATLNYLGRRLLQRKWGNGEVRPNHSYSCHLLVFGGIEHYHHYHHHHPNHSYSCHLLVFRGIWALSPLSSSSAPKPSFYPYLCFTFCNVYWFWYDFCSKYYQWLWPLRF